MLFEYLQLHRKYLFLHENPGSIGKHLLKYYIRKQ